MSHGPDARPALTGAGARRIAQGRERIVITGAGGWLGQATLDMLTGLFGADFPRRVACFGGRGRLLALSDGRVVEQRPLAEIADLAPAPSLVLHLAFVTQGPAMTLDRAGYIAANEAIAATVLEALDPIGAIGVFQASSGAVHLREPAAGPQSKGLYGALKHADEARFADWAERRGAAAVIGRVFNLSGPHINRRESYALASMIGDAQAGRPIRIRAAAPVWRSYVSIETLMGVVLSALAEGGVQRFETAGERVVEMGDLAQAITAILGAPGIDRPVFDPATVGDRYVGDKRAFDALARRHGVVRRSLAGQIRQTAAFMAHNPV